MANQPGGNVNTPSSVPIPDPTLLTTDQLRRENFWLRELIESRLDGMDKALVLIQAKADKVPSEVDLKVGALEHLHDERFKAGAEALSAAVQSIQMQFTNRDVLTDKMAKAGAEALSAALQAAKEAVGKQNESSALAIAKSETASDKRMDQLQILINTKTDGLVSTITDVKDRLTMIEGKGLGWSGAGGLILSIVAVGISLAIAVIRFGGN